MITAYDVVDHIHCSMRLVDSDGEEAMTDVLHRSGTIPIPRHASLVAMDYVDLVLEELSNMAYRQPRPATPADHG